MRIGKGSIYEIQLSQDGTRLAVRSNIHIFIYDTATYQETALLTGHTGRVDTIAFSPDGKTLAGAGDFSIQFWDTSTGKHKQTLTQHHARITSIAFSPDGNTIASGSLDNTIGLWDAHTGKYKRTLTGHTRQITSVAFHPDGKTVASGSNDNTIRLWDAHTGRYKRTLTGHTDSVKNVVFSPDGKTVASGSTDNTIGLWDAHTGEQRHTLFEQKDLVTSIAFSTDGATMASVSYNAIHLWDVHMGRQKQVLLRNPNGLTGVVFSPDGKTITTASYSSIRLWNARTGKHKRTLIRHLNYHNIAFSPDGKTIATASYSSIRLWNARTGRQKRVLVRGFKGIATVTFSPDGKTIASGTYDNTIRLWDTRTGKHKHTLAEHTYWVQDVVFSPDGKTIASGSWDNTIGLWDARTGKHKRTLTEHTNNVESVAFSPDGKTIASGSWDNTIGLWDARTGKHIRTLIGHTSSVKDVVFSPDGKTIASGSSDNTIRLWDTRTGKHKHTLTEHTDNVESVAFSPDGKTIASGSSDNTIRLWDAHTGRHKRTLTGHKGKIINVAFNPDGKTLTSGSEDNTIILWDMELTTQESITPTQRPPSLTRSTQSPSEWYLPEGAKARIGKGKANIIALSSDGKQLAVSTTTEIWIYNANTGAEIALLTGYTSPVNVIAYSPDGSTLAGISDNELYMWNARDLQHKASLAEGGRFLVYAPNSKALAIGGNDGIRVLNVRTGQLKWLLLSQQAGIPVSLTFSPDSRTVACAAIFRRSQPPYESKIYFRDAHNGQVQQEIIVQESRRIRFLSYSSDGKKIRGIDLSDPNTTDFYTWTLPSASNQFPIHRRISNGASYLTSPDGRTLAIGRFGHIHLLNTQPNVRNPDAGTISLQDADCWQDLTIGTLNKNNELEFKSLGWVHTSDFPKGISRNTYDVYSLAISSDGRTLAGASEDEMIHLWNVRTKDLKLTLPGHFEINSISYTPDGNSLATLSLSGIHLWNPNNGRYKRKLTGFCDASGGFANLAYSPDGTRLATILSKRSIHLWESRTGAHEKIFSNNYSYIDSFVFSPDSEILASIDGESLRSNQQKAQLWDIPTGRIQSTLGSNKPVRAIGFSPDSNIRAVWWADGTLEFWRGNKRQKVPGRHTGDVTSLVFSPDSSILASGSADSTIRLWNAHNGTHIGVLEGHTGHVNSIVFSPNGHTLASGSNDNTIRLWNVQSRTLTRTFDGHSTDVTSVAFSLDGTTLTSISSDGAVFLWALSFPTQVLVKASQRPPMYWMNTNGGTLHRLIGDEVENLVPNIQNPMSLAVDSTRGKIYWTTRKNDQWGKIYRANLDGTHVEDLNYSYGAPLDIALDPQNGHFYWTDALGRIKRTNLNAKNIKVIARNLESPNQIALDVSSGKLYWTENGTRIMQSNLNGSNTRTFLSGLGTLEDIATTNGKMYWAQKTGENQGVIRCSNLNGVANPEDVAIIAGIPTSIAIDPAGHKLYFTNNSGKVQGININNGSIQNIVTSFGSLADISMGIVSTHAAPAVADTTVIAPPGETDLLTNYPNPFNPETWIPYQLAKASDVKITIYNTRGVIVRQLALGHQPAGFYTERSRTAYWDGRNALGERVASGIYFYTLSADDFTATRKMLIMK